MHDASKISTQILQCFFGASSNSLLSLGNIQNKASVNPPTSNPQKFGTITLESFSINPYTNHEICDYIRKLTEVMSEASVNEKERYPRVVLNFHTLPSESKGEASMTIEEAEQTGPSQASVYSLT